MPFVASCPAGCEAGFRETDIVLPEGPLLACTVCGHLVSQIEEIHYLAALAKFDTKVGTLPNPLSQKRHDQRAARLFARVRELLGLGPGASFRLLDVGCSSGALLLSAKKEGIEVEGVEPAQQAAEAARAAGLTVFGGMLHEAHYPREYFQVVTMMEVIEHLCRPIDVMREIWNILVPGGILVIGTGNADSWTVSFMRERWDYFHMERYGGHISFLLHARWNNRRGSADFGSNGWRPSACGSRNRSRHPAWCTGR
ncbi:MAG: class I SAM-dependent methyltransferase [Nitrospira sp.]|nr:class I SAM-dependent methyltransferase [Nitrospira sp.]